jgi:hypothetical protein
MSKWDYKLEMMILAVVILGFLGVTTGHLHVTLR